MPKSKFKLGDSVVVKPNVEDPDLNINIGGWQGRISEIKKGDNLICINWDSLTLKQMSPETIDQCEEDGLDWTKMYLDQEEVEPTSSRDSEDDVEETIIQLEDKHNWSAPIMFILKLYNSLFDIIFAISGTGWLNFLLIQIHFGPI